MPANASSEPQTAQLGASGLQRGQLAVIRRVEEPLGGGARPVLLPWRSCGRWRAGPGRSLCSGLLIDGSIAAQPRDPRLDVPCRDEVGDTIRRDDRIVEVGLKLRYVPVHLRLAVCRGVDDPVVDAE